VKGASHDDNNVDENTRRYRDHVAWVLQILAAAMFLFAGGSKLAGQQAMVDTFGQIGLGQWFRYLTGIIEVGSAVLLLVPSLTFSAPRRFSSR
jgi:putative oxidoreductase